MEAATSTAVFDRDTAYARRQLAASVALWNEFLDSMKATFTTAHMQRAFEHVPSQAVNERASSTWHEEDPTPATALVLIQFEYWEHVKRMRNALSRAVAQVQNSKSETRAVTLGHLKDLREKLNGHAATMRAFFAHNPTRFPPSAGEKSALDVAKVIDEEEARVEAAKAEIDAKMRAMRAAIRASAAPLWDGDGDPAVAFLSRDTLQRAHSISPIVAPEFEGLSLVITQDGAAVEVANLRTGAITRGFLGPRESQAMRYVEYCKRTAQGVRFMGAAIAAESRRIFIVMERTIGGERTVSVFSLALAAYSRQLGCGEGDVGAPVIDGEETARVWMNMQAPRRCPAGAYSIAVGGAEESAYIVLPSKHNDRLDIGVFSVSQHAADSTARSAASAYVALPRPNMDRLRTNFRRVHRGPYPLLTTDDAVIGGVVVAITGVTTDDDDAPLQLAYVHRAQQGARTAIMFSSTAEAELLDYTVDARGNDAMLVEVASGTVDAHVAAVPLFNSALRGPHVVTSAALHKLLSDATLEGPFKGYASDPGVLYIDKTATHIVVCIGAQQPSPLALFAFDLPRAWTEEEEQYEKEDVLEL